MTPEEQQQVNAAMAYMEQQIANMAREGANRAIQCEALAQENAKLRAKVEDLMPKAAPKLEAVE